MNVHQISVYILLTIGVASALFSSIGILLVHDFYERLHYMAPAATVGVTAIAAAVIVQESFSLTSAKVLFICLVVLIMNPVLTHATARAARIRRLGQWQPQPDEKVEHPSDAGRRRRRK
ncbi:MAG: cation:proton antiporter [Terriglobia bacterium]